MTCEFSKKVLKVVVAQVCQTIGWNSIQTTPMEIMVDVLHRYIREMILVTLKYSEQFGHTIPNLDDLGLAFQDLGINIQDLEEYIKNVESVPCVFDIPKYPIPRESHLNFLKPGSREVVTRPVHVHEHLPPMHPEMEEEEYESKQTPMSVETLAPSTSTSSPVTSPKTNLFKRPGDPILLESPAIKSARLLLEEEGRPLREISSVMMTTSGFISPAREGKLPESCSPLQPSDSRSNSPQPSSYPIVPPEVKGENKVKKVLPKKNVDNLTKVYKEKTTKKQTIKEMSKEENNVSSDDSKVKKLVSIKELSKLKAPTPGGLKLTSKSSTSEPSTSRKQTKISTPSSKSIELTDPKMSKQTLNIQIKPKLDKPSQITSPLEAKPENSPSTCKFVEEKLFSEPNKHKLNIFKKISKLKEEKSEKTESLEHYVQDSQKSDTSLVIDETEVGNKQHEMHLAHINNCIESVIRKSLEFDKEDQLTFRERKSPMVKPSLLSSLIIEATSTNIDETINNVVLNQTPDSKSYVNFGEEDITKPSASSTVELPTLSRKIDTCSNFNDKKRKREKLKAKKDPMMLSLKSSSSNKKVKLETDVNISERLETPLVPLLSEALIPAPVFPFFSHFPPAPGLIPPPIAHPLFAKLPPLVLGKNLPHPAMPNLPLPPPLFSIQPQQKENPIEVKENIFDKPTATSTSSNSPNKATQYQVKNEEMTNAAIPPIKEKTGEKKNREHKKDKKDKDKSKKKKDKKDKLKIREKSQKKKLKTERKERDRHKLKEKKDKKDKRKDREHRCTVEEKTESSVPKITFKLDLMASSRSPTSDSLSRKIVIRPVIKKSSKKDDEDQSQQSNIVDVPKRELSPELARISALVTRPPKQKSAKAYSKMRVDDPIQSTSFPIAWGPKPEPTPVITTASRNILDPQPGPSSSLGRGRHNRRINDATMDYSGNQIWICPACGGHDDGSPMIGCDDCDAWYHWVCVGIQVPPDENEDWYCRVCIVKKQGTIIDNKKKKSYKKNLLDKKLNK